MPRHSQAVDATAVDTVAEVFSRIASPGEMRRFFDEILTASEMRTLALRWRLLQRLSAGAPQRKIAEELGISLCKITRGSKILKDRDSVTVRLLRGAPETRESATNGRSGRT